jgi:hypothetical protein
MRRLGHIGMRSLGPHGLLRSEPAQGVGSQEVDRSLPAAMREMAWSLAGWLGFVVSVQLLLHAFRVV